MVGGPVDPASVHLEVHVRSDLLIVADGRSVIREIPRNAQGQLDFIQLGEVLLAIKQKVPEKRDATLLLESDVDYQTLVHVMDRVRAYRTVKGGEPVVAELFPILSLGDVPTGS